MTRRRMLRVALHVLAAAAVATALAWLVPRVPVAATAVAVVGAVLLALRVLAALRSSTPVRALATAGASLVLGVAATLAVLAVVSSGPAPAEAAAAPALTDADDDCTHCPEGDAVAGPAGELTGLGVTAADGTTVTVALRGAPGELHVWRDDLPTTPLDLAPTEDGRWLVTVPAAWSLDATAVTVTAATGTLSITLPTSPVALAVSSAGGDRVPDLGHLPPGADAADQPADSAPVALRLETGRAAVQAAWDRLDADRRALASHLLLPALTTAVAGYDLSLDTAPDVALVAELATRAGTIAQRVHVPGPDGGTLLAQALFVQPDGVTSCRYPDGAPVCEPAADDLRLQSDGLVGLAADPDAVAVARAPARSVLGSTAPCLIVTSSPDDGPELGESCLHTSGVIAYRDSPGRGQRLVLREVTTTVDDAVLVPPTDG